MQEIEVPTIAEDGAELPCYATQGSAGADVYAHIEEEIIIPPSTSKLIPTGLRIAIPEGFEVQIRPRSGLAAKFGVTVLNTPGTIDSDYRGEIKVIIINHGKIPFVVIPKMRIAQLVLAPVCKAIFVKEKALAATSRADGGFGHTGI